MKILESVKYFTLLPYKWAKSIFITQFVDIIKKRKKKMVFIIVKAPLAFWMLKLK